AEEMLKTRKEDLKGKTALVSGSGNVSQYTVEKLITLGAKPVTLSDSSGYIFDEEGIDRDKLMFVMELKNNRRGRISEYADNGKDAANLLKNGCYVVSEGANMPSTIDAVNQFLDAKILFGPGKAANAGGVATSGLEMAQNSMRVRWTREEVDARLFSIMKTIH